MEANFPLQQILERYEVRDVQLAYHLSEMKDINLNTDFIFTLLKMFEEENNFPQEELNNYPLDTIIDYVHRTHRYYIGKKLPEIEQSIELLLLDYSDNHPLLSLLRTFYLKYKSDLTHHIKGEEKYLLPHISLLVEAMKNDGNTTTFIAATQNYSVKKFIDSHTDTEGDLQQVREAISEYSPPTTNQTPYRILLTQLQLFEKDLSVHAIIEDQILIPRALQLEELLTSKMNTKAGLN